VSSEPASRQRTINPMRLGLLAFGGLILVLLAARCAGVFADNRPNEAPVNVVFTSATSFSLAPVETTLHEYVHCPDSDASCRPYLTTGRSISFSFPTAYYRTLANKLGGPQAIISLSLDRNTLGPITLAIRAADEAASSGGTRSLPLYRYVQQNSMSVVLETKVGGSIGIGPDPEFVKTQLERGDLRPAGRLCDMTFAFARMATDTSVSNPIAPLADTRAFVDRPSASTAATGATCADRSPICVIAFDYRGFTGSYTIKRDQFCDWPQETRRVTGFLDRHLVRETAARPSS